MTEWSGRARWVPGIGQSLAGAAGRHHGAVSAYLSIGEFARMTHLTVKALRHYHDVGLLAPAAIDPATGYRSYAPAQVAEAQAIRRLRDLEMPIDDVRAVLAAGDAAARQDALAAHLARLEDRVAQTQSMVASLRTLLGDEGPAAPIEFRTVPAVAALAITADVTFADSGEWLGDALSELAGWSPAAGPAGALFAPALFEDGVGTVVAYVPATATATATAPASRGRATPFVVPAAELAMTDHVGALTDLDQSYGRLGRFVAEKGIGADGPIRETYLVSYGDTDDESAHRTEVGWPVVPARP
jgi:DNA-binding transcriptional MerR regulator